MTDAATLTGQDIGQAERATLAVLDSLLAQTATTFQQWVVLNTVGTNGGRVPRDAVVQHLVSALKIDDATATIDEFVGRGLATAGNDGIVLTPSGTARFERIRDGIAAISGRRYGDLPTDDLVIARRVLTIVTERANAELAHSGGA
jgi:hypothetical protein